MTQPTHSPSRPLPWRFESCDVNGNGMMLSCPVDANGKMLNFGNDEQYIVRAANAYPKLVAAASAIQAGLDADDAPGNWLELRANLRAALREAGCE